MAAVCTRLFSFINAFCNPLLYVTAAANLIRNNFFTLKVGRSFRTGLVLDCSAVF